MIIRAPRPVSNFYVLDKSISEDKRLSWAARGLLIFLLGKPDHWRVCPAALVAEVEGSAKATGRDGTYALLQELVAAGYVSRQQTRSPDGKVGAINYVVSESPLPAMPLPAEPYTAEPLPANPTLVSIESKQVLTQPSIEKKQRKKTSRPVHISEWLKELKASGEKAIREDDPIHDYAERSGIPDEFMALAWKVFRDQHLESNKVQADWRATFRSYVRGNWLKLWNFTSDTKECFLTSAGKQNLAFYSNRQKVAA